MSSKANPDWYPLKNNALSTQCASYDHMRNNCPVAYSDFFQWSVFKHADVKHILLNHEQFSNKVSSRVSVPNGMDPPEHGPYRALIEPYFSAEKMAAFKPICQAIAAELVEALDTEKQDIVATLATPFALRIQCAFMGWPLTLQDQLLDWTSRHNRAVLAQDREALIRYGIEFEDMMALLVADRKHGKADKSSDVTTQLMNETVKGRTLDSKELASLLRNWTAGEVGTIAASVSIIVHYLATHPDLQQELREKPEKLWYANDEILRMHNPLVDNRRTTTCPVSLQGRELPAGSRVTINWIAANRDPEIFDNPEQFAWDRDESQNLLYGMGVHVCPGAPLARMELVVLIRSLLQNTRSIELNPAHTPTLATYPASGFAALPVRLYR